MRRSASWKMCLGIMALLAFSMPAQAGGATYYVSSSGQDANPGSKSRPWRTIHKAAGSLVAGDTVLVGSGVYREQVVPQNSGAPGSPITYAAVPGGAVTIDGEGLELPDDLVGLFHVEGKSFIIVRGLRIENAGPHDNNAGILVNESDHVEILGNHTKNTASSGIGVWGSSHVTVDGNEVELACNDGEQESITLANTGHFEVKNNHVHHGGPGTNGGEGIDVKDGSRHGRVFRNHVHHLPARLGVYLDAWDKHTYDVEVFQNRVHHCKADGFAVASEAGGLLEDVHIYNNLIYRNANNGFTVGGYGESEVASHPMKDIGFFHNTLWGNGTDWGGGISVENPEVRGLVLRNNLCSRNNTFQIALEPEVPLSEVTVDHCFIDGFRGYEGETRGQHFAEGNPGFVDADHGDLHLRKGTPPCGRGSTEGVPAVDFDGRARPRGKAPDIGAFEAGS